MRTVIHPLGKISTEQYEQLATAVQNLSGIMDTHTCVLNTRDDAETVAELLQGFKVSYKLYSENTCVLHNAETGLIREIAVTDNGDLCMTMEEAKDPFIRNRLLLWDAWLKSQLPMEVIVDE